MIFEGYATPTGSFVMGEQVVDHAYVYCPDNGAYFDCWGGHAKPAKLACRGQGDYAVADCYRCPLDLPEPIGFTPDTACIGAYAVNGVCHQSANCFLYSAGVVLKFGVVRGLPVSVGMYGLYGTAFAAWRLGTYLACGMSLRELMEPAEEPIQPAMSPAHKDPEFETILHVHESMLTRAEGPNDILVEEFAALTRHYISGFDIQRFKDFHRLCLDEKDFHIASGVQGRELAVKLNTLAHQMQRTLRDDIIGEDNYKTIMGVDDAGETFGLIPDYGVDIVGVPVAPPSPSLHFDAAFVSQSVPTFMAPGSRHTAIVTMRNIGTLSWRAPRPKDPGRIKLGSQEPANNLRWGLNRVDLPEGVDISPGTDGTFSFPVVAPTEQGVHSFRWKVLREGVNWFGQSNAPLNVTVAADSLFVSQRVPASMVAGTTQSVSITMKNIGAVPWTRAGGYRLGSQNPKDNTTWGTRRVELPHEVAPGAEVTFSFPVRAPDTVGHHNFQWQMVHDGVAWLGLPTPNVEMRVMPPLTKAAVFVSQTVPSRMAPASTQTVSVTMRNVGTATWTPAEGYKLGSQNPMDNTRWGTNRIVLPHNVPPNGEVTFTFPVRTHPTEGFMSSQWQMCQDGAGWFGQITPNVEVRIAYPLRGALFVRQSVPSSMTLGSPPIASITMRNTGEETWTPASNYRLGSQNPPDNGGWGTKRVSVPHDVPPNTEVMFTFPMRATARDDARNFQWKMVLDGVAWFGQTTPNVVVRVR